MIATSAVNLDGVYSALFALATDGETIPEIVDAMAKAGHRWHDTPEGQTPNASAVESMVWWAIDAVMRGLRQEPTRSHFMAGSGGIEVRYFRWDATGTEEISVLYTPMRVRRSIVGA